MKLLLYLLRWQLSTPILAATVHYLAGYGETAAAVIANLIGGLIFYNVDRLIFKKSEISPKTGLKNPKR